MRIGATIYILYFLYFLNVATSKSEDKYAPPSLDGEHFRVTVVETEGWVDIAEDPEDGSFSFSGYSIDILEAVAKKANFTYELWPPSGYGSLCNHPKTSNGSLVLPTQPYLPQYRSQYLCGQGDVQDEIDERKDNYTTDLYQALFYVTPERRLRNRFTTPFIPPTLGGLQLFGIATHIRDFDDLIQQQKEDKQRPVCLKANTAYAEWVRNSVPQLHTIEVDVGNASEASFHKILDDGTCETFLQAYPMNTRMIMQLSQKDLCNAGPKGKPIGLIGDVLPFGYSQFAMGIRMDLPHSVDDTIDYWMNKLMTCAPIEESCDGFSPYYFEVGGTGNECGYIAYPPPEKERMSTGGIVGIVLGVTLLFMVIAWFVRKYVKLLKRKHKVKKRFVQQVARNVDIGTSPEDIQADSLARLFDYIDGDKKGSITEQDFRFWMTDLHLEFLSEDELSFLFKSIDVKKTGTISTMDFISFLKTCSKEFAIVSSELESASNSERSKFKSRDVAIVMSEGGEEKARKVEFEFNKRTQQNIHTTCRESDSSNFSTHCSATYDRASCDTIEE